MKKRTVKTIAAFVWIMLFLMCSSSPYFTVRAEVISEIGEEAAPVGLTVKCRGLRNWSLEYITDGDIYTYCYTGNDQHLSFYADEPVSSLYFVFEIPCEWSLSLQDGTVMNRGKNGFIHDYIELGKDTAEFGVDIPAGSYLTDVYAFTKGSPPDWVQVWEPPCDRADLMVMPTHADDEHLWFGGALPYYAGELGYKVQVVYLTNHYNKTIRQHELLNGLWTVGVRNYPIVTDKFPDIIQTKRSMENAAYYFGRNRVLEFQVEMLRRFAPKVILAHDINGEYGHGAHKLNASTLLEALKIYDDPSVFPESAEKYGITPVEKCYLHLWEENQITVQWSEMKLSRFGGKSAFEMAEEGFRCHKSQRRTSFAVKEYGENDCRLFGLAYTTVGYDTPGVNDLFEHVDMSDLAEEENVTEKGTESVPPVAEISPEDSEVLSEKKNGITLFGEDISYNDAVFAVTAAAAVLVGVIAVICVKRRE